jgi:cytochrome c oxidase assembly protein subunit 11
MSLFKSFYVCKFNQVSLIANVRSRISNVNLYGYSIAFKRQNMDKPPLLNIVREANQKANDIKRTFKFNQSKTDLSTQNAVWWILSGLILMIGASYAAVPLYKLFCESQGMDTVVAQDMSVEALQKKLSSMKKVETRKIKVKFVASTSTDLMWKFIPCQEDITVVPGETALAFFKAKNLTKRSIVGIGICKYSIFYSSVSINNFKVFFNLYSYFLFFC